MAAGRLDEPGTKYGPCEDRCHHSDCAETRRMAKVLCGICGKPIGYNTDFYKADGDTDYTKLEHAECVYDRMEDTQTEGAL